MYTAEVYLLVRKQHLPSSLSLQKWHFFFSWGLAIFYISFLLMIPYTLFLLLFLPCSHLLYYFNFTLYLFNLSFFFFNIFCRFSPFFIPPSTKTDNGIGQHLSFPKRERACFQIYTPLKLSLGSNNLFINAKSKRQCLWGSTRLRYQRNRFRFKYWHTPKRQN